MDKEVIYKLTENDIKRIEVVLMMRFILGSLSKDVEMMNPDKIHDEIMQFVQDEIKAA